MFQFCYSLKINLELIKKYIIFAKNQKIKSFMKKFVVFLCLFLVMWMLACSNDDDYGINDVIGKWECYRMEGIITDAKSGEVLNFFGIKRT